MVKNRTKRKGILTNFGAVAGRIEPIKSANYSEVMMGVSGVFNQDQLHSALLIDPLGRKSRFPCVAYLLSHHL